MESFIINRPTITECFVAVVLLLYLCGVPINLWVVVGWMLMKIGIFVSVFCYKVLIKMYTS